MGACRGNANQPAWGWDAHVRRGVENSLERPYGKIFPRTLSGYGASSKFGSNSDAHSFFKCQRHFGSASVAQPEKLQAAHRLFDGVFVAGLFKSVINGSFDSEQFAFVEVEEGRGTAGVGTLRNHRAPPRILPLRAT